MAEAATTTTSRMATSPTAIARLRPDVQAPAAPVVPAAPAVPVVAADAGVVAVVPAHNCFNS